MWYVKNVFIYLFILWLATCVRNIRVVLDRSKVPHVCSKYITELSASTASFLILVLDVFPIPAFVYISFLSLTGNARNCHEIVNKVKLKVRKPNVHKENKVKRNENRIENIGRKDL